MKNKKLIAITFVICICIGIFFIAYYSSLGTINKNVIAKESNNCEVTFNVKKSDKIKITYDSLIKEGTLKLRLTDSSGKVIENFETNRNSSKQVSIDKDGEYVLSVTYDNFVGNFKMKAKKKIHSIITK